MNKFIFPVLFGGILLIATFVLMLFQQMGKASETAENKDGEDGASETAEVEYTNGPSNQGSGLMMALQMMFEDLTGSTVVKPNIDVSGYAPEAPTGWFARDYKNSDGEAITQTTLSRGPIAKNSTNTMLLRYDALAAGKGNGIAKTYERGEQMIAFSLYVPDQFNSRTVRGGIMAAISDNMRGYNDFGKSREVFALHHGIPVTEADAYVSSSSSRDDVPVDFRVFNGDVGGMFKFRILTNSSDTAVADVLRGIPMGDLIAKLPEPEPHLLISSEFQTRDAEPSTVIPPKFSIARRAYLLSKTRLDYSARDKRLLDDIVRRRVMTWDDAFKEFGTGLGLAPDVLSLLGEMPELSPSLHIQYTARALKELNREWTDADTYILRGMEGKSITERKDADRYLKDGEEVSEEVIVLVNMLPETYDAAALTENVVLESNVSARELVIRRGTKIGQGENTFGNCEIENGVRRCIVGGLDDN